MNCNTCKYYNPPACRYFTGKEAEHVAAGNIELSVTTDGVETPVINKGKTQWPISFNPSEVSGCLLYKEIKTAVT